MKMTLTIEGFNVRFLDLLNKEISSYTQDFDLSLNKDTLIITTNTTPINTQIIVILASKFIDSTDISEDFMIIKKPFPYKIAREIEEAENK